MLVYFFFFFFFQAEDGIRDFHVTGVQTCALPISSTCLRRWVRRPCRTLAEACPVGSRSSHLQDGDAGCAPSSWPCQPRSAEIPRGADVSRGTRATAGTARTLP